MDLADVTPIVLTFNERANIARTLARLTWAREVLVVDSGSTDGTKEIACSFRNVRLVTGTFENQASKWEFGVGAATTPWVLTLDADYVLGDGFEAEIETLPTESANVGYDARFRYLVWGKPLRGTLYPDRTVLFRRERATFSQDGHTQRLALDGPCGRLRTTIDHDDRKPFSRWLESQDRYAVLEAEKLLRAAPSRLRVQDRLRLSGWAAIPANLLVTLVWKRVALDGTAGWYYTLQRALAETILALRVVERRHGGEGEA